MVEIAQKIAADSLPAERLDAFVSPFGRFQNTIGDKLIPSLLIALAEPFNAVAQTLDRAEKFRFIESADGWLESRLVSRRCVCEAERLVETSR